VPRDDVHRSALASNPERHLRANVPADLSKQAGDAFDKTRMVLVEQPVKSFALPAQPDIDPSPKHLRNACERLELESTSQPTFDAGNDRLTDVRSGCQVDLAPSAAHAHCSDSTTEPHHVQAAILPAGAYPAITYLRRTLAPTNYNPARRVAAPLPRCWENPRPAHA